MAVFYVDSSAIVKRYLTEVGSTWIIRLCEARDPESSARLHLVMVGEIALVEVAAAITKRVRKTKELGESEGNAAFAIFLEHYENEYNVISLTSALVRAAADLAQKHALRAYDAVQLATAIHANAQLQVSNLVLVFVAADDTLLQAAHAEGIATENPFDYSELDVTN